VICPRTSFACFDLDCTLYGCVGDAISPGANRNRTAGERSPIVGGANVLQPDASLVAGPLAFSVAAPAKPFNLRGLRG